MRRKYGHFNPKRKIVDSAEDHYDMDVLVSTVRYGGNPEHKKNPGDFNLTPPSTPRPAKSLCDTVYIFRREEAEEYLKEGVQRGLVSDRKINHFPKNIWSVDRNGNPLEAQLEDGERGIYHGYPIPQNDPFYQEVLKQWEKSSK